MRGACINNLASSGQIAQDFENRKLIPFREGIVFKVFADLFNVFRACKFKGYTERSETNHIENRAITPDGQKNAFVLVAFFHDSLEFNNTAIVNFAVCTDDHISHGKPQCSCPGDGINFLDGQKTSLMG